MEKAESEDVGLAPTPRNLGPSLCDQDTQSKGGWLWETANYQVIFPGLLLTSESCKLQCIQAPLHLSRRGASQEQSSRAHGSLG